MKPDLILIANLTCCRLLARSSKKDPLVQLDELAQPQGQRQASECGFAGTAYFSADDRCALRQIAMKIVAVHAISAGALACFDAIGVGGNTGIGYGNGAVYGARCQDR